MNEQVLAGRRVVVTGGLGALGRCVGAVLASRGASVALVDRAPQSLVEGVTVVIGDTDLTDPASAEAAMKVAVSSLGGIDALVNVAGGFRWEKFEGGRIETWEHMFAMNVRTAVIACQLAIPHLLQAKAACIVNVGSLGAVKADVGMGAYAASKSGVVRLTETLAEEFKPRGLRVNAVLPGVLDTPVNRADMPDADFSRWVSLEALARVIAFLLTDDAAAVTGACIPVMGGV